MSTKLRIALIGVAAIAVLALTGSALLESLAREATIPVSQVQRGSFVHRVNAEGILAAETATPITVPMSYEPLRIGWVAPDGSHVEEGDLLIRFDSTELQKQLLDGQADTRKALRKKDQKRLEDETAIANLERDADLADRQLSYSQAFQINDTEIFSRNEILESEIDQTLAGQRKENATRSREIREELSAVEIALIDLERERAEIEVERAEAGLDSLEIRAPHAGIFVISSDYGEYAQVGMIVYPRMPLAEIPQLEIMKADVFVLEADAGGLKAGIPAEVVLEAHPESVYGARVRKVAALARPRSRYSPVQYFEVELELDETDRETMKPGQRLRATLLLEDLDDVLTLPREAIFDGPDGGKVVYRRSGGGFEPVAVTLGPAALGRVVIESGLAEGDTVALQDPNRIPGSPAGGDAAPQAAPSPGGPGGPGGSR